MIKTLPDLCSITLLRNIDNHPESGGPAFTTSFKTSEHGIKPEDFANCAGAKIGFEPGPMPGRAVVRFTAIGHYCESCPSPELWEITYEAAERAVKAFKECIEDTPHFIWYLSTPDFEGRAVINRHTGTISDRYLIYRDIH